MATKPATKTVLVMQDSPLKVFIDRVIVPALVEQRLADTTRKTSKPEAA